MVGSQEKPKAGEAAVASADEGSVVAVAVLGADFKDVPEDEQAAQNEENRARAASIRYYQEQSQASRGWRTFSDTYR